MEGIDLLQNLKAQREKLTERYDKVQQQLNKWLTAFVESIRYKDGLEILPIKSEISKPWGHEEKDSPFEVRFNIYFKDPKGETYSDGSPKKDFGSDVSVTVTQNKVKINHGSCGSFSKEDKGLVSRLYIMPELFRYEEGLINICKNNVNMKVYDDLHEVNRQIDDIDRAIKKAEQDRKNAETLNQLRKAKFICKRRKDTKYKHDDKGWPILDENRNYIKEKDVYRYWDHEEIIKITEKSVLTKDLYFFDRHRRPLDQILYAIQYGSMVTQTEKIIEEDVPEEGGAQ